MRRGHDVLLRVVVRVEEFDDFVVGDGIISQRFGRNERLKKIVGGVSHRPKKERFLVFGVIDAIGFEVEADAIAIRFPLCASRIEGVKRRYRGKRRGRRRRRRRC